MAEADHAPHGRAQNLLKDQAFVAGIGNGYSDEVLWAARLAPFRKRSTWRPRRSSGSGGDPRGHAWAIEELRRAGAAPLRGRAARLPAGPPQGRPAMSALRHDPQRDLTRRFRDHVVPGLPVWSGSGSPVRPCAVALAIDESTKPGTGMICCSVMSGETSTTMMSPGRASRGFLPRPEPCWPARSPVASCRTSRRS